MQATITPFTKNCYLITLPPPLPGFGNFIAAWVKTGNPTFVVDVGPAKTAPALLEALEHLEIKQPDFILLTHIHLDHAGAAGHIAQRFPNTPMVCHAKAIEHLVDPSRLWEGSLKTLGHIAKAYGEIRPTEEKQLIAAEHFSHGSVSAIITPGHAPHHVSYVTPQCLFAGEAGGVHMRLASGEIYQRPATPPKFFLETSLHSIDLLISKNPETLCYGHYGWEENAVDRLLSHKKQLVLWKDIIAEQMAHQKTANGKKDVLLNNCVERLVADDPLFAPYGSLDPDARSRETSLVHNSITGYWEYLKTL